MIRTMVCRINMAGFLENFFSFVFLKFSIDDSEFSDLKSLFKQNVQLSTTLQTLQNDVKRRDDLINEFLERIRQENRWMNLKMLFNSKIIYASIIKADSKTW